MTSESSLVRRNTKLASINWQGLTGSVAIVVSWLCLNLPTLQWLGQGLQEVSRFNGLMLAAGGALLLVQAWRNRQDFKFSAVPMMRSLPLLTLAVGAVGAIAARWLLNLEQLPVLFSLLGTYGLLGLFLDATIWRRGLPVGAAIALLLPFGVQFNTGLGFPARILTAQIVESILKTWHIAALSSEDIIVLDTGIARIDLPCSGLKSLWTGSLFLLAATWLEGRQFGLRWLAVFIANMAGLAIANVARVLTLVLLAQVWQQPIFAEILHVPLGLMAFVGACGLGWALLRFVPRGNAKSPSSAKHPNAIDATSHVAREASGSFIPWVLAIAIAGLTLIPHPQNVAGMLPNLDALQWSKGIQTQEIALSSVEQDFFASHSGAVAQKHRFEFEGLTGSILLVSSSTWQAHHAPELCLIGSGFQVDQMAQKRIAPELLGRWLSLNGATQTAVYWFQSHHQTTDNFLIRFWQDASRQESSWTLVSVLFDQFHEANEFAMQTFFANVQRSLDQAL